MDEYFVHQLPEPLPLTSVRHQHWRESYFFVMHPVAEPKGDVLIVAMAHYPARDMMDALLMGRIKGEQVSGHQQRPYDGDPHTTTVGAVSVEIVEPFENVRLLVGPGAGGFELDATFTARTAPYGLRRGRMEDADGVIWDQSHMIQSGTYSGVYRSGGDTVDVSGWWGQRDHSWGIREHGRCPMWTWLAIQLPDGMLGVWHWELANGARVFTDGCWAPSGTDRPIPVVDFSHDLHWTADGKQIDWGTDGALVTGLAGRVEFVLEGGARVGVEGEGEWCAPYRPFVGGGQHLMRVKTDDGREGTAVYEITGVHHHHFFPESLRRS